MRLSDIYSIRRFASATLFCIGGILIATNIAAFNANTLSSVSTILEIIWCICWCMTAAHNFFYRAVIMKRTIENPSDSPVWDDQILKLRRSTHSHIKAALITATASSALVMDSYRIAQTPSPTCITRVLGSILWLNVGMFEIWMAARHERKQEKNPDRTIHPHGVKPSIYHVAHDVAYLLAGILYAHEAWTNYLTSSQASNVTWIIPIPNSCWLIAGVNELARSLQVLINETPKTETEKPEEEPEEEMQDDSGYAKDAIL